MSYFLTTLYMSLRRDTSFSKLRMLVERMTSLRVQWRHGELGLQPLWYSLLLFYAISVLFHLYCEHRPSVHDSFLWRSAGSVDPPRRVRRWCGRAQLVNLFRNTDLDRTRVMSYAAMSDWTEVGCVRSGATKSAGTLSIEIWLAALCVLAVFLRCGSRGMAAAAAWRWGRHCVWFIVSVRCHYTQKYCNRSELIRAPQCTSHNLVAHESFPVLTCALVSRLYCLHLLAYVKFPFV